MRVRVVVAIVVVVIDVVRLAVYSSRTRSGSTGKPLERAVPK